jgi:hypothetical protein
MARLGLSRLRRSRENPVNQQEGVTMSENKKGFHKTLSSIVEARGREAGRQVSYRMQHQLIGSFTKRP